MNHPRTLPIRVDPIPGEALDSWLAALAYRLHTPLGDLLPELGFPGRTGRSDDVPTEWTVLLRPVEITAAAAATGVDHSVIEAMTLSSYDGRALLIDPTTRQVHRWRLWGRNRTSRYCPDCLADTSGRWQLWWRLGWAFACPTHRRLLADVCPGCQRVPGRRPLKDLSAPGQCVQPAGPDALGRSAARCGTDLTTAATMTFPQHHPVLQAQQLVLDVIDEGKAQFGVYAQEPEQALTALSDLRAVAARILRYADRGDLNIVLPHDLLTAYDHALTEPTGYRRPSQARTGFMAPAHAAITAVGATVAVEALNSDTVRAAGEALRWLVETSRQRGTVMAPTTMALWGKGISATLKAVQLSALGPLLKPSDQLRYQTAIDRPNHHLPVTRALSRHHRVPALLWPAWALRLQPDKHHSLRALRPALAAMSLLAGTRRSLLNAADILGGIPDSHDTSRILQALEANPHWQQIQVALTRLTEYLDTADVPIDYQRRRDLDYHDLLPDNQWRHICRQAGFVQGQQRRIRLARCLLFEKISAMPADRAPASFAIDRRAIRAEFLGFAAHLTPEIATLLNAAAQEFLAHHGIHDEPVEWQPPTNLLDGLTLPGDNPSLTDIDTLHCLVSQNSGSLTDVAQRLGTTLDVVRHLLDQHPAPRQTPTKTQARSTSHVLFAARTALPESLFKQLYNDQGLALREIGQRVGVSRGTITRLAAEYDVPLRKGNTPHIVISRDWLYDQYVNHRRALPDLAQEAGMSTANMARWAKTHNIPLRSRGGASHNQVRLTRVLATTAPRILRPALVGEQAWNRLTRFAATSRYCTITEAATALGLHQAVLTTQINRLEHDLGGPLLIRAQRGHPMRPTPLGKKVIAAILKCQLEEMPPK